jgi:hypothetical protein
MQMRSLGPCHRVWWLQGFDVSKLGLSRIASRSGMGVAYSLSDFEANILSQFSQANVATDLDLEREVLRRFVGVVAGGAKLPKLVRSNTL